MNIDKLQRYDWSYVDLMEHPDGDYVRLADLKAQLAESKPLMNNWISVETEPKGEVLAISKSKDYLVGYVCKDDDEWMCEGENCQMYDVTHYQILEPPKGE